MVAQFDKQTSRKDIFAQTTHQRLTPETEYSVSKNLQSSRINHQSGKSNSSKGCVFDNQLSRDKVARLMGSRTQSMSMTNNEEYTNRF